MVELSWNAPILSIIFVTNTCMFVVCLLHLSIVVEPQPIPGSGPRKRVQKVAKIKRSDKGSSNQVTGFESDHRAYAEILLRNYHIW